MTKKIIWLISSCLMALSLVLASCAAAVTEEEEAPPVTEEEKEGVVEEKEGVVRPTVEEPQYGGTLTFIFLGGAATDRFDPLLGALPETVAVTYENLLIADWSRGPGGTKEIPFDGYYIPAQFLTGCLAESWEVIDVETLIFHIRKGVHWHNVPPVNGRELTADDVVYSWGLHVSTPGGLFYTPEEESRPRCTKIDKWTVEVKWFEPYAFIESEATSWFAVFPPEMVEEYGDLSDWRHQCGTGAFMVEDCVGGSSVTWKKNPDYWMNDPFHPENRLPYIDTLIGLVIPDEATELAALRTHKVERGAVSWKKAQGLRATNPELLVTQLAAVNPLVIFMRTDIEPFSDKRVRQALSLGIDHPAIARDYFEGLAIILTWPILPGVGDMAYTPLEELPDELRELFEYHPDKAKELLAEAGYPQGFKTEVTVMNSPASVEVMSIVKEHLKAAGVDMEMKVLEVGAFYGALMGRQYPQLIYAGWGGVLPTDTLGWCHDGCPSNTYNWSNVVDPIARELWIKYHGTLDPGERVRILKEENIRAIDLCWEIGLPTPTSYLFWVPWLKGYHGEVSMGQTIGYGAHAVYRFVWLDLDLKEEMTGRR